MFALLLVLFLTLYLIKTLTAMEPELAASGSATYFALALTVAALVHVLQRTGELPILMFLATSAVVGILTIIQGLTSHSDLGGQYQAVVASLNANQAALLILVGVAFAATRLTRSGTRTGRITLLVFLAVGVLAVLMTGSRTALYAMVLLACAGPVIISLMSKGRVGRRTSSLAGLLALGALLATIMWNLRGLFPVRLTTALASLEEGDFGGRADIWGSIWGAQDLWFPWGVGSGNAPLVTSLYLGEYRDAHNTYLLALVELGVPGLILEVAILLLALVLAFRSPYAPYVYTAMIPVLAYSMSTTLFHFKVLWFLLALALSVGTESGTGPVPQADSGPARQRARAGSARDRPRNQSRASASTRRVVPQRLGGPDPVR